MRLIAAAIADGVKRGHRGAIMNVSATACESLPGFRRRIRIVPSAVAVTAALEDDIHCMAVTLHHDGVTICKVEAEMARWPWSTCPGAAQVVEQAFTGAQLATAFFSGNKKANCTHLYDLATWAAAHALDPDPTVYDVAVSDPRDGLVGAQLYRDGELVWDWTSQDGRFTAPAEIARCGLFELRDWIAKLDPAGREAARILQWASLVAHGRDMLWIQGEPVNEGMLANCFTFQPGRIENARRIGERLDFSAGERDLLAAFDGRILSSAD